VEGEQDGKIRPDSHRVQLHGGCFEFETAIRLYLGIFVFCGVLNVGAFVQSGTRCSLRVVFIVYIGVDCEVISMHTSSAVL
jgi:hypothetical protein